VDPRARLGHFDDCGDVEGVGIHRDAAFDVCQREALCLRIAIVGAHQRGELSARRVPHDQQPGGVAAVRRDVLVDPAERGGDVAGDGAHVCAGQQAMVDGDEEEAGVGERLRLERDHSLVA
jgi:hypothetical protein